MRWFLQQVWDFALKAWPHETPGQELNLAFTAKLLEEAGEAAREVFRLGKPRRLDEAAGTTEDLATEIGDVIFVLARLANVNGIDLGMAGELALEKNRQRYLAQKGGGSDD